jgi:hypothetical protein
MEPAGLEPPTSRLDIHRRSRENHGMPIHETKLEIRHGITVVNTDVEVEVRADGKRLGTLKVSRGSIDWITSPKQIPRRLTWEKFAELAETHGSRPRGR